MKKNLAMAFRFLVFSLLLLFGDPRLYADFYINEIFFDPPADVGDQFAEYIELRGDPNMSLANHYLIFLENENSETADPGEIEYIFDLGSLATPKLGSNGFLVLRQAGNLYDFPSSPSGNVSAIAPGATDIVNTSSSFEWADTAGNSTAGFSGENGKTILENSGFTAMLIRNDGDPNDAPFIPSDPNAELIDLDDDDDNELDLGGELANWTVLDSIGVNSDADDIDGFLYAPVNFSSAEPVGGGNVPAGAEFVAVNYEIEYIGRWGDSTGSDPEDWHASNVTDESAAGYDGFDDYRQAGDPHGVDNTMQYVETNQGVPYGTYLTDNLGSSNYYVVDGDVNPVYDGEEYVFDGRVDGLDFLAIQRNFGFGVGIGPSSGATATRQHGDTNNDRTVNAADIEVWGNNYGTTLTSTNLASVPEPTTLTLLFASCLITLSRSR